MTTTTTPELHEDYASVRASEGPRSPHDALQWAHAECGDPGWSGMCLSFVRTGYNLPGVYASASDAWDGAKEKHKGTDYGSIPTGAPVFLEGSNPDGHVAFWNKKGDRDICTTNSGTGYPLVQPLDTWLYSYGYRFLGWTEDLNGYHVCNPDGTGGVPDSEVIVPFATSQTSKDQKVKAETWTTLKIDDDDGTSLITTPGPYHSTIQVNLADVSKGASIKLRAVKVDWDGNSSELVKAYPVGEWTGTSGSTGIFGVQNGDLGKASSGHSYRLRYQIFTYADVTVDSVLATWFH